MKISPAHDNALPITIWLSGGAIGFFVGDFSIAARFSNVKVSKYQMNLACAGSEPILSIDTDIILRICDSVANARLEITGLVILGKLKGLHTKINIGSNQYLYYNVGIPKRLWSFFYLFYIGKRIEIPCYKW